VLSKRSNDGANALLVEPLQPTYNKVECFVALKATIDERRSLLNLSNDHIDHAFFELKGIIIEEQLGIAVDVVHVSGEDSPWGPHNHHVDIGHSDVLTRLGLSLNVELSHREVPGHPEVPIDQLNRNSHGCIVP
jgi:hypothetical protein